MASRIQKPTEGYDWLYQDRGENDRYFTDMVVLGKHEPEWSQCTQVEREKWEKEHKIEFEQESKAKEERDAQV